MATIVSAVALNLRTVRITFSIALADATSLVISNWALACLSPGPFFVPAIASIVGVDSQTNPSAIDITGEHVLWQQFRIFAKLRNVTDVGADFEFYGPSTPDVAKFQQRERYGALYA